MKTSSSGQAVSRNLSEIIAFCGWKPHAAKQNGTQASPHKGFIGTDHNTPPLFQSTECFGLIFFHKATERMSCTLHLRLLRLLRGYASIEHDAPSYRS